MPVSGRSIRNNSQDSLDQYVMTPDEEYPLSPRDMSQVAVNLVQQLVHTRGHMIRRSQDRVPEDDSRGNSETYPIFLNALSEDIRRREISDQRLRGMNVGDLLERWRTSQVPAIIQSNSLNLYFGRVARWPRLSEHISRNGNATNRATDIDNRYINLEFPLTPSVTLEESKMDFSLPHSCSFLSTGQGFTGFQKCDIKRVPEDTNNWKVDVQIHEYNRAQGYLCGVMEASVSNDLSVVTFWEGEIIDNKNSTFLTNKWNASAKTDLNYWSSFDAFKDLNVVNWSSGRCGELSTYPYVFMRWKEKFFISKQDKQENGELTIQGFYYICMSRQDGCVSGFYYDPESQPFQELTLVAKKKCSHGFGFSNYSLR